MARTVIMDHPLIQHKIGIIRKKDTSSKEFREMISEIAMLMCYEATLQKSAEKLDANLIVLPASIHEVYLMVEREGLDMERLRDGVYGANRAFPEADYLSDEIYRYDRDTHRLSVILGSVQEEQAGMVLYQ